MVEYDSRWVEDFLAVRSYLREVAEAINADIEHVGSTAVPGLTGKPVVDIDVVVPTVDLVSAPVTGLELCGYRHEGDLGTYGRSPGVPGPQPGSSRTE